MFVEVLTETTRLVTERVRDKGIFNLPTDMAITVYNDTGKQSGGQQETGNWWVAGEPVGGAYNDH